MCDPDVVTCWGALGRSLDVQGVRLASDLRAPPRNWTRLDALHRRLARALRLLLPFGIGRVHVAAFAGSPALLHARRPQTLQLFPLLGRELRLGRLGGTDGGDTTVTLELLDLAHLGLDLAHVHRIAETQAHEVELRDLAIGALPDLRAPRVHPQLSERVHLLGRQSELLPVAQQHADEGRPVVAVRAAPLSHVPLPSD